MGQQIESNFGETMNHPRHPHPMRFKLDEEGPFKCRGCKELGFGPRYQCAENNCYFVLHEPCFNALPTDPPRTHPFMGSCEFQFLWEPPGGRNRLLCDACGRNVRGFVYHDQSRHAADLHPYCMNLDSPISDPYEEMELNLKDKVPSECLKCKRKDLNVATDGPFRGWSYASSSGNYCYHVSCLSKLRLVIWEKRHLNASSSSSSSSSLGNSSLTLPRRKGRSSTLFILAILGLCCAVIIAVLVYFNVASSSSLSREPWWWPLFSSIILQALIPLAITVLLFFIANLMDPEDPIRSFTTLCDAFKELSKHLSEGNSIQNTIRHKI